MRLKIYYETLRHLKFTQITARLWLKCKKTRPNLTPAPSLRKTNHWQFPILKTPSLISPNVFFLLNKQFELTDANSWNDQRIGKLFLYNLHYFDDLNSINYNEKQHWHKELITRWIIENSPGTGNGWEPYTLSLRIVNWIKWSLNGNTLAPNFLNSLATQIRFLSNHLEYHLLGNHLLANAKALIFAGLFFSGPEAENWLQKGLQILIKQLPEQILNDGGHFELSPMYHSVILEDMLDLINISKTYRSDIANEWLTYTEKMFRWLNTMCHPDGEIAFFNDAAFKIAPKLDELINYANRLTINNAYYPICNSIYLTASGYAHLVKSDIHVIADVANIGPDYLPGHGHADTFSFELSLKNQRIIVNSGTSTYENNDERLRQRSTMAHNTIVIDEKNSSHVWSSFRVAERAKTFDIVFKNDLEKTLLSASHNGYYRLTDKIIHCRTWCLTDRELTITDKLAGKNNHTVSLIFHFHPDIHIKKINLNNFVLSKNNNLLAELKLHDSLNIKIADSTYHPEFGQAIINKKLVATINSALPLALISKLTFLSSNKL